MPVTFIKKEPKTFIEKSKGMQLAFDSVFKGSTPPNNPKKPKPPPPQNTAKKNMFGGLSEIDNLWIAKSAIQKAYRRGDVPLLNASFDMLAASSEWEWLIRRALIFPAEEHWNVTYGTGRVLNLQVNPLVKQGSKSEALAILREHLGLSSLWVKNKTADGIRATAEYLIHMEKDDARSFVDEAIRPLVTEIEMVLLQQMLEIENEFAAGAKSLSKELWEEIWRAVDEIAPKGSSDPELKLRDQVGACYFRSKFGAMPSDKTLLACVTLLSLDAMNCGIQGGFPPNPFDLAPYPDTSGDSAITSWPWWVADMHTKQGKIAISRTAKEFGLPMPIIKAMWFYEESAKCNATNANTFWWDVAKKCSYHSKGYTIEKCNTLWENVRPFIKEIVAKMLNP